MTARDDELKEAFSQAAQEMRRVFEDGSPAVIRSATLGERPLFETAEVFDWVRRAHPPEAEKTSLQKIIALKSSWGLDVEPDAGASVDPGRRAEMFRRGALLLDASPYLPSPADEGFEPWAAKTRDALGGEFGMQAPGLEAASWDALERLQALLTPVLALTGPRTYRYNAFLGDYRRTPFGFHVDPHQEGVFQYVLHGRRTGLFWDGLTLSRDDAAWVEESNGLVAPARKPEVTFELEPGDLVFWPGTHVHGFEPLGPSMALSMVIDRASPRARSEVVAGLEVQTMGGRAALPAMNQEAMVSADAILRRRSVFPIAYERYDETLLVGVCGRTFDWPGRASVPAAMRLFDFLNENPEIAVPEVVAACADDTLHPEDIHEVLSMLAALGFVG